MSKKKVPKERANEYEKKLSIEGSLDDVVLASVVNDRQHQRFVMAL